jgi:hypothetical protein
LTVVNARNKVEANTVLNIVAVANPASAAAKITAQQLPEPAT